MVRGDRGKAWKAASEDAFHVSVSRQCVRYVMEAWCKENPDVCAHIRLDCFDEDDINTKDIVDMKTSITEFIQGKHPDVALAYKLYDHRGVTLQVS